MPGEAARENCAFGDDAVEMRSNAHHTVASGSDYLIDGLCE